jgi:hypothetical protein
MSTTDVASGGNDGIQLSGRVSQKLSETRPVRGKNIPNWAIILLGILVISLVISLMVWGDDIVSFFLPASPGPAPSGSTGSNSATVDGSVDSSSSDDSANIAPGRMSSSGEHVVPPPPPPPPNTGNQQVISRMEAQQALNKRIDDIRALCNLNSGVDINSTPACNDPNLIGYWNEQMSMYCNSNNSSAGLCTGAKYSDVFQHYVSSGTPGSCPEDSVSYNIFQDKNNICQDTPSAESADSCVISDENKNECCPLMLLDNAFSSLSEELSCFSNSPGCTINNINTQINIETCEEWAETLNNHGEVGGWVEEMVEPSVECSQILNNKCANAKRTSVGDCHSCVNLNLSSPSPCTRENINYFCQDDREPNYESGDSGDSTPPPDTPNNCPYDDQIVGSDFLNLMNIITSDCCTNSETCDPLSCTDNCKYALYTINECADIQNNPGLTFYSQEYNNCVRNDQSHCVCGQGTIVNEGNLMCKGPPGGADFNINTCLGGNDRESCESSTGACRWEQINSIPT